MFKSYDLCIKAIVLQMKNNTTHHFFLGVLYVLILFVACKDENSDAEILNLVAKVYKAQTLYRDHELKQNIFSQDLYRLISEAKEIERKSIQSIPASEPGKIKPYLLEGAIFTSLYEGHTAHSVKNIEVKEGTALVIIEFVNDLFGSTEVWTDEIVLLNENGWKLDNVRYGEPKGEFKNLKLLLSDFITGND